MILRFRQYQRDYRYWYHYRSNSTQNPPPPEVGIPQGSHRGHTEVSGSQANTQLFCFCSTAAQKIMAAKKQAALLASCKSLPNSPSHSEGSTPVSGVFPGQVRLRSITPPLYLTLTPGKTYTYTYTILIHNTHTQY